VTDWVAPSQKGHLIFQILGKSRGHTSNI